MKKRKRSVAEYKKQFCFTLLPSTMAKVEKETDRHPGRSVSLMIELILSDRYSNGKPGAL